MTGTGTLTALEIAKIACDIETDGMDFYRAAAKVTSQAENKGLFNDLAQQEFEHLGRFREIYKQLDERMGGSESTTEYLFDDNLTHYLKSITQGLVFPEGDDAAAWFSKNPDTEEIINTALESEKSSILFYSELIGHSAFTYSKDILNSIIEEEKTHIVKLSRRLSQIK